MVDRKLLLKIIRLLYLEAYLTDTMGNSLDLAKVLHGLFKPKIPVENTVLYGFLSVIEEMFTHNFETQMPMDMYKQGIMLAIPGEESVADSVLMKPSNTDNAKAEIIALRKQLNVAKKLHTLSRGLMKSAMTITKEPETITDMNSFVENTRDLLEKNNPAVTNDTAIKGYVDFNNLDQIEKVMSVTQDKASDTGIMKTFLTGINDMTMGGFRLGQTCFFNALSHNYKTGLTLSIFASLALLNAPMEHPKVGKPTIVWISLEDPLDKIVGDFYHFCKVFDGEKDRVELKDVNIKEAAQYLKDKFERSGYDFKLIRVDPTDWSYKGLFDLLTQIELDGGSIRICGLDYLSHIPKTGCSTTGALGADTRELVRRIRNWMEARQILCLTPHQLSAGADELIRQGLPLSELVARVVNNGFTADSSQIKQEYDLEIALGKFKHMNKWYLSVGRGKHRGVQIDDDSKLWFCTKFPENGNMIGPDIFDEESACYRSIDDIPSTYDAF